MAAPTIPQGGDGNDTLYGGISGSPDAMFSEEMMTRSSSRTLPDRRWCRA
jgi:hypothetical protein